MQADGTIYYGEYGISSKNQVTLASYSALASPISSVTVWVESIYGNETEHINYTVQTCALEDCISSVSVGPKLASGSISSNTYGQTITKVSTVIDGTTYSCEVSDGSFSLSYAKQTAGQTLTLTFEDDHGCTYSEEYTIVNQLADVTPSKSKATIALKKVVVNHFCNTNGL